MNDAPALSAAQCGIAVEDELEGGSTSHGKWYQHDTDIVNVDDHGLVLSCTLPNSNMELGKWPFGT